MKKITLIIASLLAFCAVVIAVIVIKNLPSIKLFSNTISNLSGNNHSDTTIFDFKAISDLNIAAKKISSIKAVSLFLPANQQVILETVKLISPDLQIVLDNIMDSEQKWLLIFQNSNEIRATGGFMGSYSIVEINDGKVISINTEDIYDADGQFTGYTQAPDGVKEYLSSGKGLRLPDANWNPDTPSSAQKILPFFALGNKKNISGVVFVNLDFAKHILSFLGPIELTDYNTIVTHNNIDEVLRSKRDGFFPGSIQKKHMLSQLITQIKIKIFNLDIENLINLANLIAQEIKINNLQFYSNIQEIDDVFKKNNMRQTVITKENSEYLYLVESNVGINKANKNVSRNIKITKNTHNNQRIVEINFQNNNHKPNLSKLSEITQLDLLEQATSSAKPNNHLAYINYQRVLVSKDWELNTISYKNEKITKINEEIITTKDGTQLKQIGFLITVKEEENTKLELTFTTNQNFEKIYVQKQPGIPATNYILEYNQKHIEHTLENNQILNW